ncbi:MAG: response regulator [Nanobdellota archaeon]
MNSLNDKIKKRILDYLRLKKAGASSSEIAKNTGHNRLTVTKYLEILKAKRLIDYETVAQAKLWKLSDNIAKRVLVVDDEPHIVELVKLTLTGKDKKVIESYSGMDALEKIKEQVPDVIILDLMMPGMDGYEVCRRLKNDTRTKHIPIIILSAKNDLKDKLKGINIGADDYLTKPFDPSEIEARVNNLLADQATGLNPLSGIEGKMQFFDFIENHKGFVYRIEIKGIEDFNKQHGARRGNELIRFVGRLVKEKSDARLFHPVYNVFVAVTDEKDFSSKIKKAFNEVSSYVLDDKGNVSLSVRKTEAGRVL